MSPEKRKTRVSSAGKLFKKKEGCYREYAAVDRRYKRDHVNGLFIAEAKRMMEEVAAERARNCADALSGVPTEHTRPTTPISASLSKTIPLPQPDDLLRLTSAAQTPTRSRAQTPVRNGLPQSSIDGGKDTSDDDDDEGLEFIYNLKKRSERFRTYKKRMVRQLHHVGAKTGCYGILYLRK